MIRTTPPFALALLLAACAAPTPPQHPPVESPEAALALSSADCLAMKLKPADPMPASAIPEEVLRKAQSGWVAMRYDVVAGKAHNVTVIASSPPGLYDAYALNYARQYSEPSGASVRGCVMTVNIKF